MSETVTQLLDRYDDDLMELARLSTQGMFDKDLYASASEARQQIVDLVAAARREVETVNEEAERQAGVICNLNTDLATLRAQLAGVREKIEKLPTYSPHSGCDYFDRDDVLAALGGDA